VRLRAIEDRLEARKRLGAAKRSVEAIGKRLKAQREREQVLESPEMLATDEMLDAVRVDGWE
jgi:hypothetical protein